MQEGRNKKKRAIKEGRKEARKEQEQIRKTEKQEGREGLKEDRKERRKKGRKEGLFIDFHGFSHFHQFSSRSASFACYIMVFVNRFRSRHLPGLLLVFVTSLISHSLPIFLFVVRDFFIIFHRGKCRSIPSFFSSFRDFARSSCIICISLHQLPYFSAPLITFLISFCLQMGGLRPPPPGNFPSQTELSVPSLLELSDQQQIGRLRRVLQMQVFKHQASMPLSSWGMLPEAAVAMRYPAMWQRRQT